MDTNETRLELYQVYTIEKNFDDFIKAIDNNHFFSVPKFYKSKKYKGIFIKSDLTINLPSKGVVNNLDINNVETLIFYLSVDYPYRAPSIIVNRVDFPFEYLEHVNLGIYSEDINVLNLCIFRGDINEWYYSVGADIFLCRVINWFFDATTGNLMKMDGFETRRYDSDDFCIIKYEDLVKDIEYYSKNYVLKEYCLEKRRVVPANGNDIPLCFLICNKGVIENNYIATPLVCVQDLSIYKTSDLLDTVKNRMLHYSIQEALILFTIKRPETVIGYSSNYEIIPFIVKIHNNYTIHSCKIRLLDIIKDYTVELARDISNTNEIEKSFCLIGCGAIGSKVSLHFARMGITNQLLIDNDKTYPHNISRHGLLLHNDFYYYAKAEILAFRLNNLYQDKNIQYVSSDIAKVGTEKLNKYDLLFDCTASEIVLDNIMARIDRSIRAIRAEIGDDGKLCLYMIEGEGLNPNLSDIRSYVMANLSNNDAIDSWLNAQKFNKDDFIHEELSIGYSCSSDTIKLEDSIISYFASVMPSLALQNFDNGKAYISTFNKYDLTKNKTHEIIVPQYIEIDTDTNWKIRIIENVYHDLLNIAKEDLENAGYLFGVINYRLKILRVLDIFIPHDNVRKKTTVELGTNGLKDYRQRIKAKTHGYLSYIGQWHTHPNGSPESSRLDKDTLLETHKDLQNVIPAVMLIISSIGSKGYVIE